MHEKLYDLLKLLLGLVTPLNVVEGNVDVFGSDLVVTTAHPKEGNVKDLSQRDDDGNDDQDGCDLKINRKLLWSTYDLKSDKSFKVFLI